MTALADEYELADLDDRQEALLAELHPAVQIFPGRMRGPIVRYLVAGRRPGDFLQAVIRNDLREAVCRADDENQTLLLAWVHLLYMHAPPSSWGSPAALEEWIERRGACYPWNVDEGQANG